MQTVPEQCRNVFYTLNKYTTTASLSFCLFV